MKEKAKKQFLKTILSPRAGGEISEKRESSVEQHIPEGVELSQVMFVSPLSLYPNPLNKFELLKEKEYSDLKADIEKRGIIVPLIAKPDGILLAGHNRLKIAAELGVQKIPVQYVADFLSRETEIEFIYKDNVLRRQLSNAERLNVYRAYFPDFDEAVEKENRGGKRGKSINDTFGGKITAKIISQKTGIPEVTVKRDLNKARTVRKGGNSDLLKLKEKRKKIISQIKILQKELNRIEKEILKAGKK